MNGIVSDIYGIGFTNCPPSLPNAPPFALIEENIGVIWVVAGVII